MLLSLQVVSYSFNYGVSAYYGSYLCRPILISFEISLNLQTLTQDTVKPRFYGLLRKCNCLLLENDPYSKRHKFYLLLLVDAHVLVKITFLSKQPT